MVEFDSGPNPLVKLDFEPKTPSGNRFWPTPLVELDSGPNPLVELDSGPKPPLVELDSGPNIHGETQF